MEYNFLRQDLTIHYEDSKNIFLKFKMNMSDSFPESAEVNQ